MGKVYFSDSNTDIHSLIIITSIESQNVSISVNFSKELSLKDVSLSVKISGLKDFYHENYQIVEIANC